MHYVGRIFGPLISFLLLDKIGRKNLLILSSIVIFSTWIIVWLTRSVRLIYIARFVFGLAVGTTDTVIPIYICENSSSNIRGVFNSILIAFFFLGEILAFVFCTYFEYNTVAIIHVAIGFLIFLSTFLLKETAQFFILNDKYKKAEKNFFWLRGYEANTKKEFEDMKLYLSEQKSKLSFELLKNAEIRKCLRIALISNILILSSGFTAINTLVSIVIPSIDTITSNELTILLGLFQFVGVCMSSYSIDQFGRRPLVLIAAGISTVTHIITASLYYVEEHIEQLPHFAWLIFVSLTTYSVTVAMILLPLSRTIRGEILPQNIKALGCSLTVSLSSIISFVISKIFLLVSEEYGMYVNFFIFSLVSFTLIIYIYIDLPETKGMTLIDIQKFLKK